MDNKVRAAIIVSGSLLLCLGIGIVNRWLADWRFEQRLKSALRGIRPEHDHKHEVVTLNEEESREFMGALGTGNVSEVLRRAHERQRGAPTGPVAGDYERLAELFRNARVMPNTPRTPGQVP